MIRLIKKYKNRRLYDTQSSQYINSDQLRDLVIQGQLFKIEDSESGKDITNTILLQIIVEMEAGTSQFLSSDILRQIICLANHPMHDSLKNMMEQMFQTMQPLENNPYQEAVGNWNQQMQGIMQAWNTMFESLKKP